MGVGEKVGLHRIRARMTGRLEGRKGTDTAVFTCWSVLSRLKKDTGYHYHTFYTAGLLEQTTTYTFKKDRSRGPMVQAFHFQDGEQRWGRCLAQITESPRLQRLSNVLPIREFLKPMSQLADSHCESREVLAS